MFLKELGDGQTESYRLLSRQTLSTHKPIDDIVLVPSISRALILTGKYAHLQPNHKRSRPQTANSSYTRSPPSTPFLSNPSGM
jgi:hypothetical protein